jgi:hypothetical protein
LISELYYDNFRRFVRSKKALELYPKYYDCEEVMVPKISKQYPFVDKDFCRPIVTDTDLKFMDALLKDSYDWNLILSKKGDQTPNVYLSYLNFLPNSKLFQNSSCIKVEGLIPLNIESISCTIFGPTIRNTLHDKGMGEFETTKKYNHLELLEMFPKEMMERPRECVVTDIYIKAIFPLNTPRRSRIVETITIPRMAQYLIYTNLSFWNNSMKRKSIGKKNKNFNSRIQKLVNIIKRRDISPFPCFTFNWRKLTRI